MVKPRPSSKKASPSPDPNALFDDDSGEGEVEGEAPVVAEPAPAQLGFEAKLVVEKGPHAGKVLKLGGGTATLGRSSKCELPLKGSPGVSRRHCKVQLVGDSYAVIDLESRNGTVVNGVSLDRKILSDGDVIEVGDEHIRFVTKRTAKSAPAPIDDFDINDRPTALLDPQDAQKLVPPPRTSEKSSSSRTSPRKNAPPPSAAPPPSEASSPPPLPQRPRADATASFFYDPDVVRMAEGDEEPPTEERPPPQSREPVPQPRVRTAAPPPVPERRSGGGRGGVLFVLVLVALVVVGALGALAYDTLMGEQLALRFARRQVPTLFADTARVTVHDEPKARAVDPPRDVVVDAGGAAAIVDAGTAPNAVVDPGAVQASAAVDAGVVRASPAVDAGVAPPIAPVAAKLPPPVEDAVDVAAAFGGHVASVRVKAGAAIAKGQTIAVLEGGGSRKKIEALREELKEFEDAAAKGNASAKRDLEKVRAQLADAERAARPPSLVSDRAGTIVEVLVKPGDVVKSGQAIARVQP